MSKIKIGRLFLSGTVAGAVGDIAGFLSAVLFLAASSGFAQSPVGSLLVVETANHRGYVHDVSDTSLYATKPGPVSPVIAKNFDQNVFIGDIVSVNGQPAKGTVIEVLNTILLRPNPVPGQAIADINRGGLVEWYFEIQDSAGNFVGSIRVSGANGGNVGPPGQTAQIASQASYVVLGGNGAFLGARGYMGVAAGVPTVAVTGASVTEDPANRRSMPGGSLHQSIYVLPMFTPEVVTAPGGPAIVHASDSSLVTPAKPAKAGEVLTLYATGLGPTRPSPEPGQPFAVNPPSVVTSPVEVIVNGASGQVLYAGGYPGAVNGYQVNFRLPDNVATGMAPLHLTSAWISGGNVTIPIQ
jgi:uncharacterized protein (TIGR03437 family)